VEKGQRRSFCDRVPAAISSFVVSLVRGVLASVAGISLAACSLLTSLDGLEATEEGGVAADSGGGVDASRGGVDASRGVDASGGVDATASDAIPFDDSATVNDSMIPPPVDSGACTADVQGDPGNCGACGHDCLGGSCASGACQPVTLAITHGSVGLAIDSTFVYWADNEAGAINKVSTALTHLGTPTAVVSGTHAQNVQGIATDGTYVYWTNKIAAGSVYRALPTGAGLTTIASNQSQPDWIASNGTTVAWTNQTGNQVMAAPVTSDGGSAPKQLNLTGENGTVPAGIAIDSANVYYAAKTTGGGLAESVPIAGGGPVSELGTATFVGIAADSNYVYWTGGSGNPSVYENTKAGTPTTEKTIAAGALICPLAITSDGANVYFLDQGTAACAAPGSDAGALYRIPIGNGGTLPPPLVGGLIDPQGIAVDGTAIYWVTGGPTGAVMKLAK
jgi:hypothetical protein